MHPSSIRCYSHNKSVKTLHCQARPFSKQPRLKHIRAERYAHDKLCRNVKRRHGGFEASSPSHLNSPPRIRIHDAVSGHERAGPRTSFSHDTGKSW